MFRSRHTCYCIFCSLLGLALAWLMLFGASSTGYAQGSKGPVSFINDVAPILKENCFACHDSKKKKGKFEMTSYEKFRQGGSKDDPVTPGKPADSVLMGLLTTKKIDKRMPPKEAGEALPADKIAIIAKWISEGAKLDPNVDPKADLMRELRIRWKPPQPPVAYKYPVNINALAFTPDNKKLVVGGYHELTVWDVASGKLEKRLYTRAERAHAMAFLPDGKLVVAGGRPGQEGDVRVYNLDGASKMGDGIAILDGVNDTKTVLLKELLETDDSVLGLAISTDGKKIASAGCDRLVRVWDISEGLAKAKLTDSIENHADWVLAVAFSADGKYLATASRDKTAKVWDLAAKESVVTFPDHQEPVYGVAILPDGKSVLSAGQDKNVRFWKTTEQGGKKGAGAVGAGGHTKPVFRMAYRDDAKNPLAVTCSADGTVRVWNPNARTMLKSLTGMTDWVYAVAISPDGTMVAGGSYKGEVRVWKTDGTLVKDFNASPGYVAQKASAQK
jgi:hypothetical protein